MSTFSGAATYVYPIDLPAGRNGLAPDVSLTYNSGALNGLMGVVQSDEVGLGWSLGSSMQIARTIKTTEDGDTTWRYRRDFRLVINGSSHWLEGPVQQPNNGGCRYYAEDAPDLLVMRYTIDSANLCGHSGQDWPPSNTTQEYWIVTDGSGTTYRFGYNSNSEQRAPMKTYGPSKCPSLTADCGDYTHSFAGYAGEGEHVVAYRWSVDRIRDVHGNVVKYEYGETERGLYINSGLTVPFDREQHPTVIRYTCDDDDCSHPHYLVHFLWELRKKANDWTGSTDCTNRHDDGLDCEGGLRSERPWAAWDSYRIDRIRVCAWNCDGNNLIAEYDLDYEFGDEEWPGLEWMVDTVDHETTRLKTITRYGQGGSGTLPVTTFYYGVTDGESLRQADGDVDPQGGSSGGRLRYPRLRWATNGYGGKVEFTYNEANPYTFEHAYSYRVDVKQVSDGLGHTSRVEYYYEGACFDGYHNHAKSCDWRDGVNTRGLIGHSKTTVNVYDYGGSPLASTVHNFHTEKDVRRGRERLTQVYSAPGGTLLRQTETQWTKATAGSADWARLDQVKTTEYGGGASAETRVTYDSYDVYGNLTQRTEYDENGAAYRQTRWGYYPNTTLGIWIVGKPGWENVYGWTGGALSLAASTWYAYDGDPRYDGQIGDNANDKGTLSAVRSWRGAGVPSSECVIDVRYGYDGWGNRTSETTYDGYGDYDTFASAGPHGTTIAYDSTYHLYPVQVRNALNQYVTTQYYGVDGVAADYGLPGQVKKVTDPNNASTEYRYDDFGRSTYVKAPDDAGWGDSQVTTRIAYANWGTVGMQRIVTWSGRNAVWQEQYLDGLGRTIQVHESADGGQEVRHSTEYDGLGRAVKEWVPYYGTHGENNYSYVPPSGGLPKTTTTYDGLGRVIVVENPDGTKSYQRYVVQNNLLFHSVFDENQHARNQVYDGLGRLVKVYEYTGDCTNGTMPAPYQGLMCGGAHQTPYALYADTIYTYDVLDNLLTVTDDANNVTTMTYDPLSRKTEMIDPDMGHWYYRYDAAGNLTQQTDARGCIVHLAYDKINRLTGKTYSGSCSGTAVSYTYDAYNPPSNYGRGRRTGMSDASGSTAWTYDVRGRTKTETKVINGTGGGTFLTQWEYDPLDRVTWIKYPGGSSGQVGEQVNYTYTGQGPVNSVSGSSVYVSSTSPDALGRVDLRVLRTSNNLRTDYVYYPWTTANGLGRVQYIKTGTSSSSTSLQYMNYAYDAVGNVLTIRDYKASGTQTQSFTYDALDRLLTAVASGGSGGTYSQRSYSYNAIGNLNASTWTYGAQSSTCPDGALSKPHTVVISGTNTYCYDLNGNQVRRKLGSSTYNLTYDAENRLTGVSGAASATFVYDGDGNRVKATFGSATTIYVGNHFEWTGSTSTMKKYYYADGARVAMRQGSTLYYILTDHLGSTAITANGDGTAKVGELRYFPHGKTRYTDGTTPTSRRFTGQVEDATIGLYFYNARYYDPALGRFVQADTIVPEPGNPQGLNRYSYVRNSPLNYRDPSGHALDAGGAWGRRRNTPPPQEEPPHEEAHSLHAMEKSVHRGADLIHTYEGYHALTHGVEMAQGGLNLVEGATYAGQMIVYGTHEAKAAAGLSPYLTHARAATHAGLVGYANPWVAAGQAIRGHGSAAALGIVYGVDVYEYQWGSKHDVGLASTEFASAMAVDTTITLGPPAAGALIGTAFAPGPGTVIGTGVGYGASIVWSLLGRETAVSFTDEHVITPLWEGWNHAQQVRSQQLETYGLQWWMGTGAP